MRPHGPVAGCGDLVPLEVQELVGRDVLRQDIVAVSLEHRREHDTVEHDIVLANEMHELGVGTLPPLLPRLREQLTGIGNVADGGVKPDIEDLALGALDGHGNAPVEVAGDGARLQAAVEPALDLAVHIGTPFGMALEYPFAEPLLVVLQGQVPVGGLFLDGLCTAELGLGIDKLLGAERAAALLALVAVSAFVATFRACTDYVAVCEESLRLRIIILLRLAGDELALVVKLAEKAGGIVRMHC